MPGKKITSKIILVSIVTGILFISGCGGESQLKDNTKVQNDIAIAMNNYNSDNWKTRIEAVKSMSIYSKTVYADSASPLLIKALDDSHSEVRIEALTILAGMLLPGAEKKIGSIALLDENANVRYFAYSALGGYRDLKNEEIFVKGAQDKDWLVKEAAIKGLLIIDDPEIQLNHIDIIIRSIRDDNISVQLAAISNINIKDPQIYNELTKVINNKNSSIFLLKVALKKVKGYKLDSKTKKRIIELLTSRDKEIRLLSLQVLKQEELNLDL